VRNGAEAVPDPAEVIGCASTGAASSNRGADAAERPQPSPLAGKFRYLDVLMALNVTFLLVSDFTGARVIDIAGVGVSVTVLYFPLTYLIGDILTEVYGYAQSRRVIWISMLCSIIGSAVAGG
jgi:hypothetical protein